uniref:Secreted protein n=1 Tax=Romanomermis culicivorax TaxID=13658 RepID=A0A915J9W5_ROMCU
MKYSRGKNLQLVMAGAATGVSAATAGCVGRGTMTTTTAACVAAVSKAGCCPLTTGAGSCRCVLTCPDPPACTVWEVEGRLK